VGFVLRVRPAGRGRTDDLLYAGSVMFNRWDGEPAYYNQSTYHGGKRILAVGGAFQHQRNGTASAPSPGAPARPGDFTAWHVDVLLEREIGGVVTVEGAYYEYDTGGVADILLPDGNAYLLLAGYMFPHPIAGGRLQPHVRYQELGPRRAFDVGLNLVGKGHIGRVSLVYTRDENTARDHVDHRAVLGAQLQY
jgi:hypothetical protein